MKNSILIGTNNAGKLFEINFYLNYFNIYQDYKKLYPSNFEKVGEPDEVGKTFEENAKIKSNFFLNHTNILSLSDDSGFIVDDLKDYPGIKTARVAKKLGGEQEVIDYIFSKFEEREEIRATFYCSIALTGGEKEIICSGKVQGTLLPVHRGNGGFGYDPYFIAKNQSKTFAEMEKEEKMLLSHRFEAFKKLASQI